MAGTSAPRPGFAAKSGGAAAAAPSSRKEPTVPPSGSLFPDALMSLVRIARGECSPCTPFFFEAKRSRPRRLPSEYLANHAAVGGRQRSRLGDGLVDGGAGGRGWRVLAIFMLFLCYILTILRATIGCSLPTLFFGSRTCSW